MSASRYSISTHEQDRRRGAKAKTVLAVGAGATALVALLAPKAASFVRDQASKVETNLSPMPASELAKQLPYLKEAHKEAAASQGIGANELALLAYPQDAGDPAKLVVDEHQIAIQGKGKNRVILYGQAVELRADSELGYDVGPIGQ